jgi:hypothetical protein
VTNRRSVEDDCFVTGSTITDPTVDDNSPIDVKLCKPCPEHVEFHTQIVKEFKERDDHVMIQVREVVRPTILV